ncbi:hypothetical protein H6G96_22235 [Nostoc sp. FACHB-892]|uniref:hypothetical protein n=1 Tax=Nostoc sp. FACHB-892 TaxID=2692843 RepID=UPI00168923A3|nr:hypothetical protein [Nostoc sp. FACHB-892]MBD2728962.1 hypothetical protein [Nostoc sp. FACHB-892]
MNFQLFQSLTYLTHNWRLQFSKYPNWGMGDKGAGGAGEAGEAGEDITIELTYA